MGNFISPGVYVQEKDISEYAPTIDSSVVGIVGFASKGPTDEATLITSPQQLIRVFGKPSESIPGQGLEGALEILEATNKVYFVRGTTDSATPASANIQLGACPGVVVSANGYGVTNSLYLKVEVSGNDGVAKFPTPKEFSIPSGTVESTSNEFLALLKVIGGALDTDKVGVINLDSNTTYGVLYGAFAGSGAAISVSSYSDSAFTTGVNCLVALSSNGAGTGTGASSILVRGATFDATGASSVAYYVESLYDGAGYNLGTTNAGETSGNSVDINNLGDKNFILEVNQDGAAIEQYKVSLASGVTWIEDVVNTSLTNAVSQVLLGYLVSGGSDFAPTKLSNFGDNLSDLGVTTVRGTFGATTANGVTVAAQTGNMASCRLIKPIEATYSLTGGSNGLSANDDTNALDLIGDPAAKTGIYALDDDVLNISIALTPGLNNQSLQNALITLAQDTQNFIAVVAPPYGSIDTSQEAIDWSNGRSETRSAAINSSYASIFWPWVKVYSVFDGIDRWYDPAIFGARQMCFTDSVSEPWFAPAGFQRGRLTKPSETEVTLNQGDRDSLYSGGNVINPIVNFPQQGITIFGQRTAQRTATALDRINVRRLMIYLRKVVLASTQSFVFEPNDPITWEYIQNVIDPLLDDIRRRRGITEYKVICDETTNTPERIDRNELWCKVLLKPTKTAEIIVFEINVTNQSAKLGS